LKMPLCNIVTFHIYVGVAKQPCKSESTKDDKTTENEIKGGYCGGVDDLRVAITT
jgi:hypothetical protein